MKNKLICFITVLLLLFNVKGVYAYEYPSNALYFEYIDETLGQVKVYVPSNQVSFLSYEENDKAIVNVSSTTVYGYFTYNGSDYRLTFPTYDTPYVRLNNTSSYTYMSINEVIDTNINFVTASTLNIMNDTFYKNIVITALWFGGAILCLIWLRR